VLLSSVAAFGETLYGAFGTALVFFDSALPTSLSITPIGGLVGGDTIVGADFRPVNGLLYAVGSGGRLYTINVAGGAATFVATLAADPTDFTSPFVALSGTAFGVDVNPVADRIRIVSNTGQNLRVNPVNGFVTTDGDLNPGTPSVVAAAYTNNNAGATFTNLYTIDSAADTLNLQSPPNNGLQLTVGSLGVNVDNATGFDICANGVAYASMTVAGTTGLYTINIATGAATLVGNIGFGNAPIESLSAYHGGTFSLDDTHYTTVESGTAAVTINRIGNTSTAAAVMFSTSDGTANAPADYTNSDQVVTFNPGETTHVVNVPIVADVQSEPNETIVITLTNPTGSAGVANGTGQIGIIDDDGPQEEAIAIRGGNTLLRFTTDAPSILESSIGVSGLVVGDTIAGADFRPADGQLYAIGSGGRLYTINLTSGAATFVAGLAADPTDFTSPYTSLSGTAFGVDFNPVPDRIRVVSDSGQNLRINPANGLVTTDDNLNGATSSVQAAAYTNNFAGATLTTLYVIDSGSDQLYIQNPPNNGTETVVGILGQVDATGDVGFDISPSGTAYATMQVGGITSLFQVDLALGFASFIDTIDDGNFVGGSFSVVPNGTFQFSMPTYGVGESGPFAAITINRVGGSNGVAQVTFTTTDGSANAPADYADSDQVVTFADGVTTMNINVPIVDDPTPEGSETVTLTLTSPTGGAVLGPQNTAVLTITDNDSAGVDLSITKSANPNSVAEGNNVTFTITVTNNGGTSATNVVVSDPLPSSFTPGSATPSQGSCNNTVPVSCTLGTLNAGATATVTIVATANAGAAGNTSNSASVSATETDPNTANNASTAPVVIFAPGAANIPTLDETMLLMLAALLATVAILRAR
jgi:uncharacterized repeat protein (TIGR01451 family)